MEKEDAHLSLETLARLLAGTLEHDDLLRQVVPHLLELCPGCRDRRAEIAKLQERVGHWSPEVAVFEGLEAERLWHRLADLPLGEQLRLVEEDESLHAWGLTQRILDESRARVIDDPARAATLANLALRLVRTLAELYHPDWIRDLRARCFAHLGNARRVLGELRSADDAFRKAADCLARGGTGDPRVRAEIVDLESSLRCAQRQMDEALALADRALTLYRESGDAHGVAKMRLQKAKILEEMGALDAAAEILTASAVEIDRGADGRLFAYARFNLAWLMVMRAEFAAAAELVPEIRDLLDESGGPLDRIRLRWMEANIDLGLGRPGPAESTFREVQREFLARGMGYDAALVSLDLAALYAAEGSTEALKRLAVEVMPVFEARDVHREAFVALLLFQRACEEERLTAELARQIARQLWRERSRLGGV